MLNTAPQHILAVILILHTQEYLKAALKKVMQFILRCLRSTPIVCLRFATGRWYPMSKRTTTFRRLYIVTDYPNHLLHMALYIGPSPGESFSDAYWRHFLMLRMMQSLIQQSKTFANFTSIASAPQHHSTSLWKAWVQLNWTRNGAHCFGVALSNVFNPTSKSLEFKHVSQ